MIDGPGSYRARRRGRFPDEPKIRDHPSDYCSGYLARVAHYLRCQPHLWGSALLTRPLEDETSMIDVLAGLKVTAAADSDTTPRSRGAGHDVYVGRSGHCQRRFGEAYSTDTGLLVR